MASDDSQAPDPNHRRGCQFSLWTILFFTAIVAVITAVAARPFSESVAQMAIAVVAATFFVLIGVVAVVCVFWAPVLLIIWVRSLIVGRRRPTRHGPSSSDSSSAKSNSAS